MRKKKKKLFTLLSLSFPLCMSDLDLQPQLGGFGTFVANTETQQAKSEESL